MYQCIIRHKTTKKVIAKVTEEPSLEKINTWVEYCNAREKWGKPDELDVVITDLTKEPSWINNQAEKNRRLEYPTTFEKLNALIKAVDSGDNALLKELIKRSDDVDKKYPKVVDPQKGPEPK